MGVDRAPCVTILIPIVNIMNDSALRDFIRVTEEF